MVEYGPWIKSGYSKTTWNDFECVEMRTVTADRAVSAVQVRDSKNKSGPQLAVSPNAWASFVAAL